MRRKPGWAPEHSSRGGEVGRSAKCSRRAFIDVAEPAAGAGVLGGLLGGFPSSLTGGSASAAAGWSVPGGEITETFWDSTSLLKTSLSNETNLPAHKKLRQTYTIMYAKPMVRTEHVNGCESAIAPAIERVVSNNADPKQSLNQAASEFERAAKG